MKKFTRLNSILIPIAIIVCMIIILIDIKAELLGIVCGGIIGMQIMLIVDAILGRKKER